MNLEECKTIKQCFLWAEQEWPGFWEFANCKQMGKEDVRILTEALDKDEDLFARFIQVLNKIAPIDKSKDATRLLISGAKSLKNLQGVL